MVCQAYVRTEKLYVIIYTFTSLLWGAPQLAFAYAVNRVIYSSIRIDFTIARLTVAG